MVLGFFFGKTVYENRQIYPLVRGENILMFLQDMYLRVIPFLKCLTFYI